MFIGGFRAGILAMFCASAAVADEPELVTAPAMMMEVVHEQQSPAVVEAINKATISAQTSGQIVELNFDINDYVREGTVIVRLKDVQHQAAVNQAQARYEEALAEYKRTKDVFERKLTSQANMDLVSAALKSASASLTQAKEQREYTVVRAPYSGVVTERFIELGEMAQPGQPLMSGMSLENLRVSAQVPQREADKLKALPEARILIPGQPEIVVPEPDIEVSPVVDPASHTVNVRLKLPSGQQSLRPGMFARLSFATDVQQRLLIPLNALVRRSELSAVYVVKDNGELSFRQVRPGRVVDGKHVELLAGLSKGEKVALDPVQAGVLLKGRQQKDTEDE